MVNNRLKLIIYCLLVVPFYLSDISYILAQTDLAIFENIKLRNSDMPDYVLQFEVEGSAGWQVVSYAPGSNDLAPNYTSKVFTSLVQQWVKSSDYVPGEKLKGYISVSYGIFETPSQALLAMREDAQDISYASDPMSSPIGDYSLSAGRGITFIRGKILVSMNFLDSYIRFGDDNFKRLADLLIQRIDAQFVVTATPDNIINELHSLEYMKFIDKNSGILRSLEAKIEAVKASMERGQNNAAKNQLEAFINEVKAQSGKSIETPAANALITEAQSIISGL